MKRILTIILATLCEVSFSRAEDHLAERLYLSTDRDVYVAGERIWCSAFCTDASDGTMSDFSSIAYLELHSAEGLVQTAKISLRSGRGGGSLQIPVTAPTGNYVLLAYTALNLNEDGFDPMLNAKELSVFNTFTSTRAGEVKVVEEQPAEPVEEASSLLIKASFTSDGRVRVRNLSGEQASFSLSVYRDDGLAGPQTEGILNFSSKADVNAMSFTSRRIPEYDGEIVKGRIAGGDPSRIGELEGKFAFISVPGDRSDTYSCQIDAQGNATFFTNNFYGDKDLVCQIEGLDAASTCHLEVDSPFVDFEVGQVGPLTMSPSYYEALLRRSIGVQVERLFDADTLYDRLPVRDNLLFGTEGITYVLDDYTRLPLMEECIVEFIQELRARKDSEGRRDLQVRLLDNWRNTYFAKGSSLMMVDGVPVFDHETIYRYDPLLVETVNIYPYTYFIGTRGYNGVVNFVTYKQNLPSVKFPDNVRILSFQGASYPEAYTCSSAGPDYPDYRQTAYWHPLLDLGVGEQTDISVRWPEGDGSYVVTVEGMTVSGVPFRTTVRR